MDNKNQVNPESGIDPEMFTTAITDEQNVKDRPNYGNGQV